MGDCISRADAIQALVGITAYNSVEEIQAACFDSYARANGWLGGVMESIAALAEEIPAADVRPVVYCKECIHLGFKDFSGICNGPMCGVVKPWDYCSHGVRGGDT